MSDVRKATPLKSEDYPTERSWIGSLFASLNPFFLDVGQALNGGLVYGENLSAVTATLIFSYTGTASDFPKKFAYGLSVAPSEVRVCQCLENSNRRLALVNWTYDSAVSVTDIAIYDGTTWRKPLTGGSYRLTLRAHP